MTTGPEHIAGALLLGAMVGWAVMLWLHCVEIERANKRAEASAHYRIDRQRAEYELASQMLDRRLAIRKAKRAANQERARKGWQTRRGKRDAA